MVNIKDKYLFYQAKLFRKRLRYKNTPLTAYFSCAQTNHALNNPDSFRHRSLLKHPSYHRSDLLSIQNHLIRTRGSHRLCRTHCYGDSPSALHRSLDPSLDTTATLSITKRQRRPGKKEVGILYAWCRRSGPDTAVFLGGGSSNRCREGAWGWGTLPNSSVDMGSQPRISFGMESLGLVNAANVVCL